MNNKTPQQIINERLEVLKHYWEIFAGWVIVINALAKTAVNSSVHRVADQVKGVFAKIGTSLWDGLDYLTPRLALSVFVVPMLMLIPILIYTDAFFTLSWLDKQVLFGLDLEWEYYYILLGLSAVVLINTEHPHALALVTGVVLLYATILLIAIFTGGIGVVGLTAVIYIVSGSMGFLIAIKFGYRVVALEERLARILAARSLKSDDR